MPIKPFHIAVPVTDLAATRAFYGGLLGCAEGRSADERIDWNFFGHHLVTHVEVEESKHVCADVVSAGVLTPVRHFGVVLESDEWSALAKKLEAAGAEFYMQPQTVHPGSVKEQQIMLVHDTCGNIVEFKASTHGLFDKKL